MTMHTSWCFKVTITVDQKAPEIHKGILPPPRKANTVHFGFAEVPQNLKIFCRSGVIINEVIVIYSAEVPQFNLRSSAGLSLGSAHVYKRKLRNF